MALPRGTVVEELRGQFEDDGTIVPLVQLKPPYTALPTGPQLAVYNGEMLVPDPLDRDGTLFRTSRRIGACACCRHYHRSCEPIAERLDRRLYLLSGQPLARFSKSARCAPTTQNRARLEPPSPTMS